MYQSMYMDMYKCLGSHLPWFRTNVKWKNSLVYITHSLEIDYIKF